jgi:hypothetical protein
MTEGNDQSEFNSANEHQHDPKTFDIVTEATAQAAAGATTDVHDDATYGDSEITNGAEPDPDLAQGESD